MILNERHAMMFAFVPELPCTERETVEHIHSQQKIESVLYKLFQHFTAVRRTI